MGAQMSACRIKRLGDVGVMSFSKLFSMLFILSVFVVPFFVSGVLGEDSEDVAAAALNRAEVAMFLAYEAVSDAEEAGAHVNGLLAELNVGGEYLAEAHVWNRIGDFETATYFADLCYDVIENIRSEAAELENEANGSKVSDLVVRMAVSIVGVVVVIFLSFLVWRVFKRRYHRRVLGLRPEVVSGES
jgi:hypothetical protein